VSILPIPTPCRSLQYGGQVETPKSEFPSDIVAQEVFGLEFLIASGGSKIEAQLDPAAKDAGRRIADSPIDTKL